MARSSAGYLAPRLQSAAAAHYRYTDATRCKSCANVLCHFGAPAALLICYDKRLSWKREFDGKDSGDIDASIVTTHMMLEAAALGVGTTWVMYFIPEAVRAEFELPDSLEPTALLMMGYPAPDAKPAPGHAEYRPLSEIVTYDKL